MGKKDKDKGGKGPHQHVWILVRREVRGKNEYRFYECAICSKPKMEVN